MPSGMDEYAFALDQLRILAQQDLADWWANTDWLAPPVRMDTLREAFHAIQATYGEQAAYLAADHLFLQRSLDDTLSELEFPEVADPAGYEQARAGFNWATAKYREEFAPELVPMAREKLAGVLNRLVSQPAHDTVAKAVETAGTGYARVPEPGACSFCLMLASRGAVYSKESVQSANGYHDNCRCVGIEVKSDADLPRINRELHDLWQATSKKLGDTPTDRQFQEALGRYQNRTPEWIPFGSRRVRATPRLSRGPKASVKTVEELEAKGLIDHPSTLRAKQPNKKEISVWEKEETILRRVREAHPEVSAHRVARLAGEKTPDFVIDGKTIDAKTANLKRLEQRVSEGSSQAQGVIIDLSGETQSEREVQRELSRVVENHGDRVELVVIMNGDSVVFWERGR